LFLPHGKPGHLNIILNSSKTLAVYWVKYL
jgi:hypothetical protein